MVRDAQGLTRLLSEIDGLQAQHGLTAALAAARLVAACALARNENRGAHFRTDAGATATPRRTFLRFTELAAQFQRYAAE